MTLFGSVGEQFGHIYTGLSERDKAIIGVNNLTKKAKDNTTTFVVSIGETNANPGKPCREDCEIGKQHKDKSVVPSIFCETARVRYIPLSQLSGLDSGSSRGSCPLATPRQTIVHPTARLGRERD